MVLHKEEINKMATGTPSFEFPPFIVEIADWEKTRFVDQAKWELCFG